MQTVFIFLNALLYVRQMEKLMDKIRVITAVLESESFKDDDIAGAEIDEKGVTFHLDTGGLVVISKDEMELLHKLAKRGESKYI